MILVVAPELCRTGGVQRFSNDVVNACYETFGASQVAVFSRNDSANEIRQRMPDAAALSTVSVIPSRLRRFASRPVVQRMIRKVQPSVVVCTHPHLVPAAIQGTAPVIGVCHGVDAWNMPARLKKHLAKVDRLLAVSHFTRDRIVEQIPLLADRAKVFPNTFDPRRFQWGPIDQRVRDQLKIPGDATVLLAITRLDRTESPKGYDDVIRCLPKIREQHPNTYFVLGGRGADLPRVEQLANDLGVADQCRFPGFVRDQDLAGLYQAADVFVLPSRKEGFGIVFIEALACGLSVIAGNRDGSRDALLNGELGRLVTPGSQEELSNAILEELAQPRADRREAGRHRSQRVLDEFGPEHFQKRLNRHLDDVRRA